MTVRPTILGLVLQSLRENGGLPGTPEAAQANYRRAWLQNFHLYERAPFARLH